MAWSFELGQNVKNFYSRQCVFKRDRHSIDYFVFFSVCTISFEQYHHIRDAYIKKEVRLTQIRNGRNSLCRFFGNIKPSSSTISFEQYHHIRDAYIKKEVRLTQKWNDRNSPCVDSLEILNRRQVQLNILSVHFHL